MIEIPVLNIKGERIRTVQMDPAIFGARVRYDLLKQAVVAYRANQRQGTAATKSRGMVEGSTRKLYRQKGTGRARAGNIRTPLRRGGGRTFAKTPRDFSLKLPRQMRRLARDSAILAKAMSGATVIVEGLEFGEPKTSRMAGILKAVKARPRTLVAVGKSDDNLVKSVRNIPEVQMKLALEVNAYDVLRARHVVFTPEGYEALTESAARAGRSAGA